MRKGRISLLGGAILGLIWLSGCSTATTSSNDGGSSPPPKISGKITWVQPCGTPPPVPTITVTLNSTPPQQVQTDVYGYFNFANVANGNYTITPSYSGPAGSSSVFLPSKLDVTEKDASLSSEYFQVALGYSVSGAVTYSGPHTGRIYVSLVNDNCGASRSYGTSISTAGNYTIHGVQPNSYTLRAWMDPQDLGLGQGLPNAYDPAGGGSVTVGTSNFSSGNVTLANNDASSAPNSAPTIISVSPMHNGVVVQYNAIEGTSSYEAATSYDVAWSSSPALSGGSLANVSGTLNYKAIGTGNEWFFLNNDVQGVSNSPFADGNVYYLEVRANNSAGNGPWGVYGGSNPTGVTVGAPSPAAGIPVTTVINIPSEISIASGAPLYIGYLGQDGFYGTEVTSPQAGYNSVTITVPQGSWLLLGTLDVNNDGEIDAGDFTNSRLNGPSGVTVSSGTTTLGDTLPTGNAISAVQTVYYQDTTKDGSSSGYTLPIYAGEGAKLPVAVTLTEASNPDAPLPMDLNNYCIDCRNADFQYDLSLGTYAPSVGDTYTMKVTYSDGSQDTVTASVTGWNGGSTVVGAGNLPTNLSPTGTTSSSTTPTFTWTNPGGLSSSDYYNFYICCSNNHVIWQIPGEGSHVNNFTPSITSIIWGTDPTGETSNTPNPSSLTTGTVYTWALQLTDDKGNTALAQTWYQP